MILFLQKKTPNKQRNKTCPSSHSDGMKYNYLSSHDLQYDLVYPATSGLALVLISELTRYVIYACDMQFTYICEST